MQNPVFKLEKVVRSKSEEEMQDFEGPLDLILYLLGKNKMEIQDISISLICDQYMAWLARRQEMDLEVASEFVTMASQLVYIKTRMLLSIEDEEAQSEMDALIASLEERKRNENYAKVKSMAARLEPMGEFGRNILTRPPEPPTSPLTTCSSPCWEWVSPVPHGPQCWATAWAVSSRWCTSCFPEERACGWCGRTFTAGNCFTPVSTAPRS